MAIDGNITNRFLLMKNTGDVNGFWKAIFSVGPTRVSQIKIYTYTHGSTSYSVNAKIFVGDIQIGTLPGIIG